MKSIISLTIAILLFSCQLFAAELTETQKRNYEKVYKIASKYNVQQIMPAICMVETELGDNIKNRSSFGIMQLNYVTSKWILEQNDKKVPKNLKKLLKKDHDYNIIISCIYFKYLLIETKGDIDKAILAYNVGINKVKKFGLRHDPNNYLRKVKKHIRRKNENF